MDDYPEYPVESAYLKGVRQRVNLARTVDKLSHSFEKQQAKKSWFVKAAEEADLDLDEDLYDKPHCWKPGGKSPNEILSLSLSLSVCVDLILG
jgi:hypothetical protein